MTWLRRKSIDRITQHEEGRRLVPTLSWPHLVALGIGAIVGTGIYTLIGVGADKAGPAVLLSFVIAGSLVQAAGFHAAYLACAAVAVAALAVLVLLMPESAPDAPRGSPGAWLRGLVPGGVSRGA